MSRTTRINKTNQEEVKMRKLIVEAPELKEGQQIVQEAFAKTVKSLFSIRILFLTKNQSYRLLRLRKLIQGKIC